MFSFKIFLNEVLNNPYKWRETSPKITKDIARYIFTTDNNVGFHVEFFSDIGWGGPTNMSWQMDKYVSKENPPDETNKFRILNTVADITNNFLEKYKPDILIIRHIDNSKWKVTGPNKRLHFVTSESRTNIFNKKIKHKDYNLSKGRIDSTSIYTRK